VKVVGDWAYLYRAVDSAGETIEFMLSPKRDLPNRVHGLVTLDRSQRAFRRSEPRSSFPGLHAGPAAQ
jgi:DDE domain